MMNADRIQPYSGNPTYWQYKGEPVLLLGGSKTDHIFLLDDLEEHLDEIKEVGGNYVRNTMSQREAKELKPYRLLPDGKFDLDQWNEEYWRRFQNMLRLTAERDIFVQIEVWDRFDYSTDNWTHSPWNPAINVTYTTEESGLVTEYPQGPWKDKQPFFHSVEGVPQYRPQYDLIRRHQETFVRKMLSYSLDHGHVLYCMNNETTTDPAWGQYWMRFIRERAVEKDLIVHATDMFDDIWKAEKSVHARAVLDSPDVYTFVDISQVNSRNFGQAHWDRMQWLVSRAHRHPRPVNHTKIYGSGHTSWGSGGPEDGVERFWRNIIGGCASARFHRGGAGNGLNSFAKATIRAARKLEGLVRPWEVTPAMELLSQRGENEAYVAAEAGQKYALYFPKGGSVVLDLSNGVGEFAARWISVASGEWGRTDVVKAGGPITITAPDGGGWAAALVRQ